MCFQSGDAAGGHVEGGMSVNGWNTQAAIGRQGAAVLVLGSVDRVDVRAETGTSDRETFHDDKGSAILNAHVSKPGVTSVWNEAARSLRRIPPPVIRSLFDTRVHTGREQTQPRTD